MTPMRECVVCNDGNSDENELRRLIEKARRRLLRVHYEAHAGHLGGNLSCLDAMMTLYHSVKSDDDIFLLSKGHSAAALYVTLWSKGLISEETLDTFARDGTALPGHPSGTAIPGMLFPTGSLGHGFSLSCGLAVANKYKKSDKKVFCMCSDGEWQEGSCWESLIFAVCHHLDNLTVIIDQNGLQAFGTTNEVACMEELEPKIASFGANAITVNGHDIGALQAGLGTHVPDKPSFVFLRTVKGRGAYFENEVSSHYLPLTCEQYEEALAWSADK
jgi:transketolase